MATKPIKEAKESAPKKKPKAPQGVVVAGEHYIESVGRRKTSVARVRLFTKGSGFFVNEKEYKAYFPTIALQYIVEDAIDRMKLLDKYRLTAHIKGGGIHSQAEALRHGIARALVKFNPDFRKRLKKAGFLERDARAKERRKFGLKKARRAGQWSKR